MGENDEAKPRLLIVDDYAPTRLSFASQASEMDCFAEVRTLASGEAAKAYVDECLASGDNKLPDIVLTDLYMEGLNGIELLIMLRQQHKTSHIAGALMSVGFDSWERAAARESLCRSFFRKPSTAAELRSLLHSVARLGPSYGASSAGSVLDEGIANGRS